MDNRRLILVATFLVVLIAGWVIMIYFPSKKELDTFQTELSLLEEKERQKVPEVLVKGIEKTIDSLSMDLDSRLQRFFPEERLTELGKAIDTIGQRYSLRLMTVTPDYESLPLFGDTQKEISEWPLTVEFKGTFKNLTRFLDDVAKFPFAIRFQDVLLEKENSKDKELDIELKGVAILRRSEISKSQPENLIASNQVHDQT